MIERLVAAVGAVALMAAAPAEKTAAPVGTDYRPTDKDERGLWMLVDEAERELKTSEFVIRDPALNAYVRGVFCRTVGETQCGPIRIYILHTPDFNASMAPNGMMVVNSGLLLRVQDEAELSAILGHEFTHFSHRHSLQAFRDAKSKTNAMAWLSVVPVASYGAAAALTLAQLSMIGSFFQFSRAMESEADAGSVPLMTAAGYDPHQAPKIWQQIRAEQDATAAARHRRSRKNDSGLFATHPPTAERMAALQLLADRQPIGNVTNGRDTYRAAMRSWWPMLIDDQIKLNDFGATDFLIGLLGQNGWTPELLYARGELYRTRGRPDDLAQAAGSYQAAIALPGAPVEASRGLGLVEMRSGKTAEGRAALKNYLAKKPDAPDRAMIAMLVGENG